MKIIQNVLAVLALVVGSFGVVSAAEINLDKMDKQIRNPSVQIGQDGRPFCSGTIIQSKRDEKTGKVSTGVLTAQHCVNEAPFKNFEITIPKYGSTGMVISREVYVGKISKQGSDTNDLAIIALADDGTSFADRTATVADKSYNPRSGSSVYVSGYPAGRDWAITEGRFSSREEYRFPDESHETEYYRTSASIIGGNSGGGLFDVTTSGDFQLIGVADWGLGRGGTTTFGAYTPADRVSEFITSWSGYKK